MPFEDPLEALDADSRNRILETLDSGELIEWTGQPGSTGVSRIPLLFCIGWLAMVLYLFFGRGASNPNPLFGIPFVAAGLLMLWKVFQKRDDRRKIMYALTSKRALIIGSKRVHDFPLDASTPVFRIDRNNGRGDLIFDAVEEVGEVQRPAGSASGGRAGGRMARRGGHPRAQGFIRREIGFKDIPNVADVEEIINQIRNL